MSYIVVDVSEDGEVSVSSYTEEQLLAWLNERAYRAFLNGRDMKFQTKADLFDVVGNFEGPLIIRGEVVQPKAAEVVKSWTVSK